MRNNKPSSASSCRTHSSAIYYQDGLNDWECLCAPEELKKQIFELAHGRHNDEKLHRTYGELMASLLAGTLGSLLGLEKYGGVAAQKKRL